MKQRFFAFAVVLSILGAVLHAAGPEEDYVRIYNLIQEADRHAQSQRPDQARTTYLEAQSRLGELSKQYPDWSPNIIQFRLNYVSRKLKALESVQPAAPTTEPQAQPETSAPPTGDPGQQVEELRARVRQLEREKTDLGARLREALGARPASVDPQELALAEARVLDQQKEIELLRINLEKVKQDAARSPEASGDATRQALADAQRQLNEQAEQINTLTLERNVLQNRLLELVTPTPNTSQPAQTGSGIVPADSNDIESLKRQMQSLHQQLAEEQARNRILVAEQQLLQQQLASNSGSASDTELSRRVRSLEQELETARQSNLTDATTISALQTALASANQQVNTLQGRVRALQPQSAETRLDALLNPSATVGPATSPAPATTSPTQPATEDIAQLKARLAMLEARRVPYSPEELALFKVPEISTETNATSRAGGTLSRDTALLIAEAEKDLRAGRFEEAERKYQEALATDQNNVAILSSLASAQTERGNLVQAEQTLATALARDPNDAFTLFMLGRVRFEQGRIDEAMTALSQSAAIDGSRAETFNLLGIALSQLGLREPAETALRRAVQIAPNYASAHHNLAVVYSTQNPPSLGLARWHYEKAIAGGHTPDPAIENRLKAAANP